MVKIKTCGTMCPLDDQTGIWICIVLDPHPDISPALCQVHTMTYRICAHIHPRQHQRKEIAVGTQFIYSRPPAKCWQATQGHNPHVVNHKFASLGSMWFRRQRLWVYIPRCHMYAVSGQLWFLYMYMATNHYRLLPGWWTRSPTNSPYASPYSKMSWKLLFSIGKFWQNKGNFLLTKLWCEKPQGTTEGEFPFPHKKRK